MRRARDHLAPVWYKIEKKKDRKYVGMQTMRVSNKSKSARYNIIIDAIGERRTYMLNSHRSIGNLRYKRVRRVKDTGADMTWISNYFHYIYAFNGIYYTDIRMYVSRYYLLLLFYRLTCVCMYISKSYIVCGRQTSEIRNSYTSSRAKIYRASAAGYSPSH